MDLFDYMRETNKEKESPLASRMRPVKLEEVVGQQHIIGKDKLVYPAIKADKLGSVIFYGPPGTGKTTLAKVIANTTESKFTQINATVAGKKDMEEIVKEAKDLYGMYQKKTILFIDEIHRLNNVVEEKLYTAMEDFTLDIIIGKGPSAQTMRLPLNPFTLVGATTRAGMLSSPLRDRFGVINRLELYNDDELQCIVERSARIMKVGIETQGAREIARRSRGTPRIANRLLRRVRDYAEIKAGGVITREVADQALRLLEVDELGLDQTDRSILEAIVYKFGGGPVGLETLAATTGEESVTIEDVYEPYLLQLGFLQKTPRGRVATALAYKHLGAEVPASLQQGPQQTSMLEGE